MDNNKNYAIGIDLGTSTSEIAIFRNGKVELIPAYDSDTKQIIIPSVVAISMNNEIIVGEIATSFLKQSNRCVKEIKRKMGTDEKVKLLQKEYTPQEISAFILKKLKNYAEKYLGQEIKDVVISVPAKFSDSARKATKDAAEIAGLNPMYIINEPTAAALAYGIDKLDIEEDILVFDFGGGTLDISILSMVQGILDVKYSDGDPQLGGKNINEALAQYILKKSNISENELNEDNKQYLVVESEKAKKRLTYETSTEVYIPNFFKKDNKIIDLNVKIDRTEFEKSIEPIIEKAKNLLDSCIKNCTKTHKVNIQNVLLVGGTTYIPAIKNIVNEYFHREFQHTSVNPDEAVARGAAIKAADKLNLLGDNGLLPLDVCSRTLGISTLSFINNQVFEGVIDPLILKNTKIPHSISKDYHLIHSNQDQVEIKIYQGDGNTEEECEFVCSGTISNIPPSNSEEPHKIVVEFSYDMNTIATVKATIPATNQSLVFSENQSGNRMDENQIQAAKERINTEWKENSEIVLNDLEKSNEHSAILNSAEELLKKVFNVEDNLSLKNSIDQLKQAILSKDQNSIEKSIDELSDKILDLQMKY